MAPPSTQADLDPEWAAQSNLPRFLVLTGIFNILALISVGLRLYARIGILRTPGRDDYVIVLASLGALTGWICFILQSPYGLGRHTATLSRDKIQAFEHIAFWQSIISAMGALGLLKISIAFFLLRLSNHRWYSRTLWMLISFVVLYTVGAWLTYFLRCKPMSGFWDPKHAHNCYPLKYIMQFGIANSAFNIFTDVCFATLPIPIVWNLQMSQHMRLSLIAVLSPGYSAVAMGIVKTIYQLTIVKDKDQHFNNNVRFWGFVQLNVGIIAASIPTLKPFLRKVIDSSSGNRYNQFKDGDKPHTIGSGPPSRPRKSVLSTLGGTRTDTRVDNETYEMWRTNAGSIQAGKNEVYAVSEKRTGSEDHILSQGDRDSKQIRCITEVVVNNEERGSRV